MNVLCSVGTTHPWNIAGIGLDARVCARLGVRHVAIVAGVSAQGGNVFAAGALDAPLVAAQFAALRGAGIGAYRVGALLSPQSIAAAYENLEGTDVPVVCDPVLASSRGEPFAAVAVDENAAVAWRNLFSRCSLVTPNLAEASVLCGFPVNDPATMAGAAHTLVERDGARAALVTGGHLPGDASDVLYAAGKTTTFEGSRIAGGMRGTGCVLATAIAVHLMNGSSVVDAIERARALVREAIANAVDWYGERVWPW
ncbi:MAG: bifunctional hydroxymethylpyrimidine kinase/phosphomethylpyrimidine kinase [Candidatus Eremiobacteraeota bacterium]|nr:bifunctional hydroxymethylpyrimidine kinase/phosphomethylpyrimidine kinase [Candidatus Eremiobacteraeota bacterium]